MVTYDEPELILERAFAAGVEKYVRDHPRCCSQAIPVPNTRYRYFGANVKEQGVFACPRASPGVILLKGMIFGLALVLEHQH